MGLPAPLSTGSETGSRRKATGLQAGCAAQLGWRGLPSAAVCMVQASCCRAAFCAWGSRRCMPGASVVRCFRARIANAKVHMPFWVPSHPSHRQLPSPPGRARTKTINSSSVSYTRYAACIIRCLRRHPASKACMQVAGPATPPAPAAACWPLPCKPHHAEPLHIITGSFCSQATGACGCFSRGWRSSGCWRRSQRQRQAGHPGGCGEGGQAN